MRFRDEVLIQLRIKSDDLDRDTLAELAQLLISMLEIMLIIFKVFADVIIGIVHGLEWLSNVLKRVPYLPARWGLAHISFAPPMG